MVQLMKTRNFHLEPEPPVAACRNKGSSAVKVKFEDFLEQQHGPDSKRSRISRVMHQWDMVENSYLVPPPQYNPLDEPSPLGLKLRKSPSLLELIQMQLAHGKAAKPAGSGDSAVSSDHKKDGKSSISSNDKLKASNFPASLLKIGNWEYTSRYEGDLVAKCYFAKHKLVWEVLDGGLKSKIEIQWSDIIGLKADCPEDGDSTLRVVLARQPLFFRETNPQPRKHTLWQATSDFTNGEASMNRLHLLQCPQGMLHKHFEKLIQCDMGLNFLSNQPEVVLDSPFFDCGRSSGFEELEPKPNVFDPVKVGEASSGTGFQDSSMPTMPHVVQRPFFKMEQWDLGGRTLKQFPQESLSPSSVMSVCSTGRFLSQPNGFQVASNRGVGQNKEPAEGLRTSMSKLDLMDFLDKNVMNPVEDHSPTKAADRQACLENIADYLLNDSDSLPSTDERSLLTRVNSLYCLIQEEAGEGIFCINENPSTVGGSDSKENQHDMFINQLAVPHGQGPVEARDTPSLKLLAGMIRKDSFSDLLHHLPRISSLPKIRNNISEDNENHFF